MRMDQLAGQWNDIVALDRLMLEEVASLCRPSTKISQWSNFTINCSTAGRASALCVLGDDLPSFSYPANVRLLSRYLFIYVDWQITASTMHARPAMSDSIRC